MSNATIAPTFSPAELLLSRLEGGMLAVSPEHFAGLRNIGPLLHVRVGSRAPGKLPPGITLHGSSETIAALFGNDAPPPEPQIARVNGRRIAVLDVTGFLTKSDIFGRAGLITLREQLGDIIEDEEADAILLRIDSPGGTVAGVGDLAAEILKTRKTMPVWAFAEDLCAASAYWIASQAERVYANTATALVGDIGTLIGLYDRSKQFSDAGVKPVLIRTGRLKGLGFPGTEITKDQQEYLQGLVGKIQAEFDQAIKNGRGIDPAKVNTGRLYIAGDAVKLSLIDGIKTFDDVLAELAARVKK